MSESSTTTLFISKLGFNLSSEFPAARSLSFGTLDAKMLRRALTMMPKLTRGMSKDARPMTR